jgi:hypothetical protein
MRAIVKKHGVATIRNHMNWARWMKRQCEKESCESMFEFQAVGCAGQRRRRMKGRQTSELLFDYQYNMFSTTKHSSSNPEQGCGHSLIGTSVALVSCKS